MKLTNHHELIIIGGGAAGLFAAISASLFTRDVLIIDANTSPGRKIAATGNGKCNFTNLDFEGDVIRSASDMTKINSVLARFSNLDCIAFFENNGIPLKERNGYCYPYSGQASSVQNMLQFKIREAGIKVQSDTVINTVKKLSDGAGFQLVSEDGREFSADRVLLSTGGLAQPCYKNTGKGYALAKALGHSCISPLPALVGLTLNSKYLRILAGVRAEANVTVEISDGSSYREYGEIIFSKTGISGIPVMNLSRFAVNALEKGLKCRVALDFFEKKSDTELSTDILKHFLKGSLNVEESLCGLLNNKLVYVGLQMAGIDPLSGPDDSPIKKKLQRLAQIFKRFEFEITGSTGFENAQVTSGGIPLDEVTDDLESVICPGLYFAGEILDVDGRCGGYNLQWAWSSGAVAGACQGGGYFDKDKFLKA